MSLVNNYLDNASLVHHDSNRSDGKIKVRVIITEHSKNSNTMDSNDWLHDNVDNDNKYNKDNNINIRYVILPWTQLIKDCAFDVANIQKLNITRETIKSLLPKDDQDNDFIVDEITPTMHGGTNNDSIVNVDKRNIGNNKRNYTKWNDTCGNKTANNAAIDDDRHTEFLEIPNSLVSHVLSSIIQNCGDKSEEIYIPFYSCNTQSKHKSDKGQEIITSVKNNGIPFIAEYYPETVYNIPEPLMPVDTLNPQVRRHAMAWSHDARIPILTKTSAKACPSYAHEDVESGKMVIDVRNYIEANALNFDDATKKQNAIKLLGDIKNLDDLLKKNAQHKEEALKELDALESKFKAYLTTKPKRILRSNGPSPAERYRAINAKYNARHSEDRMFGRDSGATVTLSDILRLKNERPNDREAQKLYNDVEKVYDAYPVACYQLIEKTNGQFANTSRDAKYTKNITTTLIDKPRDKPRGVRRGVRRPKMTTVNTMTKTQYGDRTVIKTPNCRASNISAMMRPIPSTNMCL